MTNQGISNRVRRFNTVMGIMSLGAVACRSAEPPVDQVAAVPVAAEISLSPTVAALGTAPGAEACIVGTNSIRIAQRVTTSGGLATNGLSMESLAVANGGANINNFGGAQVRISGATINGTVYIAGAAPSQANGELINGGVINGPVITGAGVQSTLPTTVVSPGTTNVTQNSNSPPRTLTPGNYGTVTLNGSATTFSAGTYNLAALTINSGTVTFNTTGGAVNVNVQGLITVNGGTFTAGNSALVTLYSNSSASNAVVVNAGITTFPATVTAPNGNVTIGSRVVVNGCVGGKNVDFEPDSRANGTAAQTGCADGTREGFVDLNASPNIAGCSGGWSIPGVMITNPGVAPACAGLMTHDTVTPACNRMGGDDGLNPNGAGCNVADLCAAGWHVCSTAADIASHSATGCTGAVPPEDVDTQMFFVSRQSSNGCGVCATGTRTDADCNSSACTAGCAQTAKTSNDIFGCGNIGNGSSLLDCGPIDSFGNDLCSALTGTSWSCNDGDGGECEAYAVTHATARAGGALCCRD
jgi:hypothetical protein